MIQPCCGSSLQQGTKFLAMLSMILSVAGMAISGVALFSFLLAGSKSRGGGPPPSSSGDDEEDIGSPGIKYFISLCLCIFNLFLAILLFIGAEQKNLRLCQVWFKVSIFLLLADIVWFLLSFIFGIDEVLDNVINSCGLIYSLYELWVVFAFISEIKSQKDATSGCHTMSTLTV